MNKQTTFAFVIGLFSLVAVYAFFHPEGGACTISMVSSAIQASSAANCFEFWLNRYQSLIAGLLSLFAASIAAYLVWQQVFASRAANVISMKAQSTTQYEAVVKRYHSLKNNDNLHDNIVGVAINITTYLDHVKEYEVDQYAWGELGEIEFKCNNLNNHIATIKGNLSQGIIFVDKIKPTEMICSEAVGMIRSLFEQRSEVSDAEDQMFLDNKLEHFNTQISILRDNFQEYAFDYGKYQRREIDNIKVLMAQLEKQMLS